MLGGLGMGSTGTETEQSSGGFRSSQRVNTIELMSGGRPSFADDRRERAM